tara:strand:+ start:1754 stop:2500 length:747 start_codon:yes stop_codon:yes gene_type:complete
VKAIILAGGYGTRLYPLTETVAKPFISVAGKSIIDHIIDKLINLHIDDIFVVTNNKFYRDFVQWKEINTTTNITIINDMTTSNEDRLGAIGDIQYAIDYAKIDDDVLIIGGDNLFEDNLINFIDFFKMNGSCILLNDVKSLELAKLYGNVTVDEGNRITNFVEKPENPESTLAATLIYAIKREHIPLIRAVLNLGLADHSGDFIKFLSENEHISALLLEGTWFDIGSLDQLHEANESFRNLIKPQNFT